MVKNLPEDVARYLAGDNDMVGETWRLARRGACLYMNTCDIKELPLYINHRSTSIRNIVKERLEAGV